MSVFLRVQSVKLRPRWQNRLRRTHFAYLVSAGFGIGFLSDHEFSDLDSNLTVLPRQLKLGFLEATTWPVKTDFRVECVIFR
jgi:hypothetical protein